MKTKTPKDWWGNKKGLLLVQRGDMTQTVVSSGGGRRTKQVHLLASVDDYAMQIWDARPKGMS